MTEITPARLEAAKSVHKVALAMSEAVVDAADPERVMALANKLSEVITNNINNADMMMALALIITYQAHDLSADKKIPFHFATAAVCATLSMLAQSADRIELPTNPMDIH